jgi:hypothetical protein
MWQQDNPQDDAPQQHTLGLGIRHAGSCIQTLRRKSTCSRIVQLIISFKAINLFISSADQLYGPITVLRRDGRIFKKIPWTAFALSDSDWDSVLDAKMILAVSYHCSPAMPL